MITFSNMTHGEFISANVAEAVTPLEKELFERLENAADAVEQLTADLNKLKMEVDYSE